MVKNRLLLVIILVIFMLVGCSKADTNSENSPVLNNVQVVSYNEGSQEKQFVKITLTFDREIQISGNTADSLRMTIAGERVKESDYKMDVTQDNKSVNITIQVSGVSNGKLYIGKSDNIDTIDDITDSSGKFAVQPFSLDCLIPSGISLSTVGEETISAKVTKSVDSTWNIRSIAWIQLMDNGECVEAANPDGTEMLDGAVAVHGHDFLNEDNSSTAQKIVDILTEYYGDAYHFECENNQITVEKLETEAGSKLDLKVYSYIKFDANTNEEDEETQG